MTLVCIAGAEERVRATRIIFVPIGLECYPAGSTRQLFNQFGELSGTAAFKVTVDHFKCSTAMLLEQGTAVIHAQGNEALVIDQTSFLGCTVAHALVLLIVSVSSALLLNGEAEVPPANTGWHYSSAG